MKNIKSLAICLSVLFACPVFAVVVGSNSLVSLQPLTTFPATDVDNAMLGFAWFKNGFTLEDATTTCVFNDVFPVSGVLNLNGGTLSLLSDLTCGSGVTFLGDSSVVNLNDQSCNFGQSDSLDWSNSTNWQGSIGSMNFFSNIILSNAWSFSGHCVLTGNGHTLDLTNGSIIVQPGSTLEFRDITLKGISGTNITCIDNAGLIVLDQVTWQQAGNFIFLQGSLQFENEVNFTGNSIFGYQSPQVSTLFAQSTLTLDSGFTFSYDPGTSPDLLAFVDNTSQLVLNNNATLWTTLQGLNLIKGSILVQTNGLFVSEVNGSTDNGITVGDCISTDDFIINIAGGAQLTVTGSLNYKDVNASSFNMLSDTSSLFINDNASLNLYQNLNGPGLTAFGNNSTLGTSSGMQLLMGSSQQGTLNFVILPAC
ncbi:MAG: hypothetical protein P4L31_02835 [Candidatus Babeliales bacterium]|nr:hypothetical protein [Candidatus Babeliales bacterium]